MGLVFGGQPLFQGQALVLLGALQRGRGQGDLVEGFGVEPGLFFQLLTVSPALDRPGENRRSGDQSEQ
ncbi:MAG: hypothetical protein ACJ8HF_17380 [Pseudomonas sp.]